MVQQFAPVYPLRLFGSTWASYWGRGALLRTPLRVVQEPGKDVRVSSHELDFRVRSLVDAPFQY